MEVKLKICSDCGKPSKLWRSNPKLCKSCAAKPKHQKKKDPDKVEAKKQINVFFANQALVFPIFCENCGDLLRGWTIWDKRKSTCHLIPKSLFPSVATNPQNKIFMCCGYGCNGHAVWDNGDARDRIKMDVYDIAIARFKTFMNLLNGQELVKACKYLGIT